MSSISGWYFPCFTDFLKDKIADLFAISCLPVPKPLFLEHILGLFLESILKHGRKANHLLTSRVYAFWNADSINDSAWLISES